MDRDRVCRGLPQRIDVSVQEVQCASRKCCNKAKSVVSSDLERYVSLLDTLHLDSPSKLLARARAVLRINSGETVEAVGESAGLPIRFLLVWLESINSEGLHVWLKKPEVTPERMARARAGLAQMLVGMIAEEHFESISKQIIGDQGYQIQDERVGRTDTDYRLIASDSRAICRFNIKFHGTKFEKAKEWVELDPDDCFALATYKIDAALKKQDAERLPFVFLVISVLNVPRSTVQESVSYEWAWLAALSDRATEEAIVARLAQEPWVEPIRRQVRAAQFRVMSARRGLSIDARQTLRSSPRPQDPKLQSRLSQRRDRHALVAIWRNDRL